MLSNQLIIKRAIESIRQCLDEGIILNVSFTEQGQIFDFFDLKREWTENVPKTEASYAYERQLDGKLIEFTEFNKEFYPIEDADNTAKH